MFLESLKQKTEILEEKMTIKGDIKKIQDRISVVFEKIQSF